MKRLLIRLFHSPLVIGALAALPLHTLALAEESETLEPVVVTASRVATPQSEVAQSITVIEPTESDRQSGRPIFEILRSTPGLTVINSGGAGQLSSVYIRGAAYQQTLIMVDGVIMNDPSNPGRGYDFGRLTARQVDRIEVLSGSQSGVHGANAIGGVINIITRRQTTDSASIFAEYGAFATRRASALVAQKLGSTVVNVSAGYDESDGFPAASPTSGNRLNNGYSTLSGTLSTESQLAEHWKLQTTVRSYRARTELPYSGGPGGDDPNYLQTETQGTARAELRYQGHETWEPSLAVSYFKTYRRNDNEADAVHTTPSDARYHGARLRVEQLNQWALNETHTLILGMDSQIERASVYDNYEGWITQIPSASQSITGLFAEDRWRLGSAFASVALRGDRFHGFGDQLTYRFGPGYRFETTGSTFKGSVGRGFKIPSLDQLYAPTYGSQALSPETSLSYDFTVIQEVGRGLSFQTTWFENRFSNLIQGDPNDSFKYKNISSATTRGLETSLNYRSMGDLTLAINHTFLQARNNDIAEELLRRPKHALTVSLRARSFEKLDWGVAGRFVGARKDTDPATFATIRMPSYTVFNADASYSIGDGYKAFGRLDNLLDREYEEVAGYGTARRSFYFGLQKEI